jgi:hypothetical protein
MEGEPCDTRDLQQKTPKILRPKKKLIQHLSCFFKLMHQVFSCASYTQMIQSFCPISSFRLSAPGMARRKCEHTQNGISKIHNFLKGRKRRGLAN